MPLSRAHYYLIALLVFTLWAFWPSYLSDLPAGKPAWHVHAAGSLLWVGLAILQSWSIHSGRRALHRSAGLASFLAFPLFLVGGLMAIHAESVTLAAHLGDPEYANFAQFGFFDPLANIGFSLLFYGGLKARRNIQLHARYMLSTVMFLVAPVIWRLLRTHFHFFNSGPPESPHNFSYAFGLGNLVALAIAIYLYRKAPKHGQPFLIAAGFIFFQWSLFETAGRLESWALLFSRFSTLPLTGVIVVTFAVSVAIMWRGWVLGRASEKA